MFLGYRFIQQRPILLKFKDNKCQVAISLVLKFQSKIFTTFDARSFKNTQYITVLVILLLILRISYSSTMYNKASELWDWSHSGTVLCVRRGDTKLSKDGNRMIECFPGRGDAATLTQLSVDMFLVTSVSSHTGPSCRRRLVPNRQTV
eukprot:sb/3473745/